MLQLTEASKAVALSPLPFLIIGILALVAGLIMLMRPRQVRDNLWKFQQRIEPYWRVQQWPVGATVFGGCFCLVLSGLMLYASWEISQR